MMITCAKFQQNLKINYRGTVLVSTEKKRQKAKGGRGTVRRKNTAFAARIEHLHLPVETQLK